MRNSNQLLAALLAFTFSAAFAAAQGRRGPQMTPSILKTPADWRFETMPVPPRFAPDVKLTGFEEIRFAPGVFDKTSPNYWTYVMVVAAEGDQNLGAAEIKDYLEKYYRGLSVGMGGRKGLSPDPKQMTADVAAADPAGKRYTAKVIFFDTFNDGGKVTLNVEAHVIPRPKSSKTYLLLLISPKAKDAAQWKNLRAIEPGLEF